MTVLVPELLVAPAVTVGAVYCAENFLPRQMEVAKRILAKHVVEPQLHFFETLTKGLRKAHKTYEEQKHKGHPELGDSDKDKDDLPVDPKERAYAIADNMAKYAVALTADFASTFALQHLMDKMFGAHIHAGKTAVIEAAVHLGGVLAMPTLFPKVSENIHHNFIRKTLLQKMLGMDKEKADDIAKTLTYVTLPGFAAAATSLVMAHHTAANGR